MATAIRRSPLVSFVVLAYAVSWAWAFPFVAAGDVVKKGVGWPTHFPALLGPALAALVVTAVVWGRAGVRDLLARMARWRVPLRWWAATLSPLAFLGVALAVALAGGNLPRGSDFGRYSGLSAIGVLPVWVIAILITFGEETGWRGFALPLLQRRHDALAAALLVTPIWAVWHLPYFFTVTTYRNFAPVGYVGFVFGLACGSIVLTWLYNGTGGSILACAVWHGLYNLGTGTAAATGTIQGVTSTLVYVQVLLLVGLELRARRRGEASILGPRKRRAAIQASNLVDTVSSQPPLAFREHGHQAAWRIAQVRACDRGGERNVAAVVSTLVMLQAALLMWLNVRAVRHGRPSPLSPQ